MAVIKKIDRENKFISMFNNETGAYMRTGVLEEIDGQVKDTGVDPFMTSFPELIDIGIMARCINGESGKCTVQCYQNAVGRSNKKNMALEEYTRLIKQMEGKVFQCLREDEVIITKENGLTKIKQIKDVNVGDMIYNGKDFVNIYEVNKKISNDLYRIKTKGGLVIDATSDHKFPIDNELKEVKDIKPGDSFNHVYEFKNIDTIDKLDIVKIIIENGLDDMYYINSDTIKEIARNNKIKISQNSGTVRIDRIKHLLNDIDYSNALINKERSPYSFKAIYVITKDLMKLLGHYVGNGSKRTYVIGNNQKKMISEIERCLNTVFNKYYYRKDIDESKTTIELSSMNIHVDLFDTLFNCRTKNNEKQLPNFILNVSKENKIAFLQGYMCDGTLKVNNSNDGNYGSITFNTSSNKLYKDMCLLLASLGVQYRISSEPKTIEYYKGREINRKRRFKILISNKLEINKIIDCVNDHYNAKVFKNSVQIKNELYSYNDFNTNEIISIEKINKPINVIDININSKDRLFVTSNGWISHNCALGGAGDVDTHENFEEILKVTRDHGIVPNFTTSGIAMTEKKAKICKQYVGACAVSEYHQPHTKKAIELLIKEGVTTNLHYVLGNDSIDEAIRRLKEDDWYEGLNAVVFLLHKPIGLGSKENVLDINDPKVKEFYKTVDEVIGKISVQIGFDSCNVPALINLNKNIDPNSVDTCEAGRWSMYITPESLAIPCSFDNQAKRWAVDLKEHTIKEAWDSDVFNSFRDSFKKSCGSCKNQVDCKGGCPLCDIVICNRPEKDLFRIM